MKRPKPASVFYYVSSDYPRKTSGGSWRPNADIYETDEHVVVALEVPGVEPADLEITELGDKLVVRGVRRPSMPDNPKRFHQIEIVCGEFEKEIVLSKELKGAPVEASLALGVLYVKIAKTARPERAVVRRIEIEA